MAINLDGGRSEVCGNCRFWDGLEWRGGDFGLCKRYPSTSQKWEENWCGEWKATDPSSEGEAG